MHSYAVQQAGAMVSTVVGGAEHFVQRGLSTSGRPGRRRQTSRTNSQPFARTPGGPLWSQGHGDGAVGKVRTDFVAVAAQGRFCRPRSGRPLPAPCCISSPSVSANGARACNWAGTCNVVQDELDVGGVGLVVHVVLIAGYA